ncbi:MAG: pyrroline-5-carboxylate reductase [Pseudomonadota bacterium]
MDQDSILLVGCGNMGFAMLKGWIDRNPDQIIYVVEPEPSLRTRALQQGVHACSAPSELNPACQPGLVFFAVKPQLMAAIVPHYRRFAGHHTGRGQICFVSIAAGVTLAQIGAHLPEVTPIVRVMPNTPAAIGHGMMVACAGHDVEDASRMRIDALLQACGQTAWVDDETLLDAVTAISGSGPAYLFHFIECLVQAGRKLGLDQRLATQLAVQTVYGSAALAQQKGEPSKLREQVTSPGGTTEAALSVLMGDEARCLNLIEQATCAAFNRSRELGSKL